MQIASEFAELNTVKLITKNLITSFEFEYGYITKLPSTYDSETEKSQLLITKSMAYQQVSAIDLFD